MKLTTYNREFARQMLVMMEAEALYFDGKNSYRILSVEVKDNSETVPYGGFFGGEPGMHHIQHPPSYIIELERV